MAQSYQDLRVWKLAMELARDIYAATERLSDEEKYGLKSQLRRSAISIPSNIAEGWGRNAPGDFCRFLNIATGSRCEVETQLLLSNQLGLLNHEEIKPLTTKCMNLNSRIRALQKKVAMQR